MNARINKADQFDISCFDENMVQLISGECRQHKFNIHFHYEFTLGLVEEGQENFLLDGTVHRLRKGAVYLLPPFTPHASHAVDGSGWKYRSFYINATYMEMLMPHFCKNPFNLISYCSSVYEAASKVIDAIDKTKDQNKIGLLLQNSFISIINQMIALNDTALPIKNQPKTIIKARDAIKKNLVREICIDDLADLTDWHPHYLINQFQIHVGISPMAYIKSCRLEQVKMSLASGEPIAEAAICAGFYDQSHLSRHFKRAFGVTPGAFRQAFW